MQTPGTDIFGYAEYFINGKTQIYQKKKRRFTTQIYKLMTPCCLHCKRNAFLVSIVTVKLFFLFLIATSVFVYFSLVQNTLRDRQSSGTLFFEVLGRVIKDKQRSNKMQLEKNVVILVAFTRSRHQKLKSKPWNA